MDILLAILIGVGLDFLIGDPQGWFHPVRLMGWLISRLEIFLRRCFPKSPAGERFAGGVLWVLVVGITMMASAIVLHIAFWVHPVAGYIAVAVMSCQSMATKSLKTESMKVYASLKRQDIEEARFYVSMIVGRDTQNLDAQGIAKAAVETVAENTSDGSVAPLCYLVLGGPVFAFAYKAVNTMDSMIGYDNEKYCHFGYIAAKMDDILNFIPARLAALWMVVASYLCGFAGRDARRIFVRDRHKSKSPNAAQTESVCAGALGVELLGDAMYFGELHHKEVIGDAVRPIEAEDIRRANRLLYVTVCIALACLVGMRSAVFILFLV